MKKFSPKELLFIRNLLFTAVLGGFVGFLNYLFNIFVARYTSENIFNIFSATVGIVYLLQIPTIAIQSVITKKVGEKKDFNLNAFKWRTLLVFTVVGLLFSFGFYLIRGQIVEIASIPSSTTLSLTIVLLFAFIGPVAKGILLGQERIIFVNIVLLLETIARFVIGYFAIKGGNDINLLILSSSVPTLVSTILILPFIKQKGSKETKPIHVNYKELVLMVVSFLMLSAPYTLDLILVNPSFRAEYSALTLIGKIVYFGAITISSAMFARLANQKNDKNKEKTLILSLAFTFVIGLGISLGIYMFKDILADVVFNGKYTGISNYLTIYGICMTLYAFVYMVINYFMTQGTYLFISILFTTTTLQIILFEKFNSNIEVVVRNQVIVYGVLFLFVCFNLLFRLKLGNKKDQF